MIGAGVAREAGDECNGTTVIGNGVQGLALKPLTLSVTLSVVVPKLSNQERSAFNFVDHAVFVSYAP